MNKGLTFVNLIIILHILAIGSLLLAAKSDYWVFLDWLTQPLLEYEFIIDLDSLFTASGNTLFLIYALIDAFKAGFIEFLIVFDEYDFITSLTIINIIIFVIASIYLVFDRRNIYSVFSVAVCFVILSISLIVGSDISKSDVDRSFSDYVYKDVTGIDYLSKLREGDYALVEDAFSKVHDGYNSGNVSEGEYEYEFHKFNYATDQDLEYFNKWVEAAKRKDVALMIRGHLLQRLGWKARGGKYIHKTSPKQISEMKRLYTLAVIDHIDALKINEGLLFSYISLIDIASSMEIIYDKKTLYTKARKLFPNNYLIAVAYIFKISPKWGGSFNDMRALAIQERKTARNNPMLISIGGRELYYRGYSLYLEKNYQGAINKYKKSLLYGPKSGTYSEIFHLYKKLEDYKGAKEVLDACLKYRERHTNCLVLRAVTNIKLLDGDSALVDATTASNNGSLTSFQHSQLGWVFERIAYYEQAIKHFIAAVEKNPVDGYSLEKLYTLSYDGRIPYKDVLPYFKKSVELDPANPKFWIHYADILEDVDRKGALPAYRKYLEFIDHNDSENKEAIRHVTSLIAQIESE